MPPGGTLIVSSVFQASTQLACPGLGGGVTPCSHLNIWLHTTQAEAQLPGEGSSGHVPDSFGHMGWEIAAWEAGGTENLELVGDSTVPKSPSFPSKSHCCLPGQQHHAGGLPTSPAGLREEEL